MLCVLVGRTTAHALVDVTLSAFVVCVCLLIIQVGILNIFLSDQALIIPHKTKIIFPISKGAQACTCV